MPADLIVLSSSNVDGIAYADTIDLDGEADLKMKVAVKETKGRRLFVGRELLTSLTAGNITRQIGMNSIKYSNA